MGSMPSRVATRASGSKLNLAKSSTSLASWPNKLYLVQAQSQHASCSIKDQKDRVATLHCRKLPVCVRFLGLNTLMKLYLAYLSLPLGTIMLCLLPLYRPYKCRKLVPGSSTPQDFNKKNSWSRRWTRHCFLWESIVKNTTWPQLLAWKQHLDTSRCCLRSTT